VSNSEVYRFLVTCAWAGKSNEVACPWWTAVVEAEHHDDTHWGGQEDSGGMDKTQEGKASLLPRVGAHETQISCTNMLSKCIKYPCIHLVY
jgi:hypothetical protein